MDDFDNDNTDVDEQMEPVRPATGREKFSVLLPALVALAGLIVMVIIFAALVSMSRT